MITSCWVDTKLTDSTQSSAFSLKSSNGIVKAWDFMDGHWDLKVAQALNKCGVIAVVQLLRTMPTRSKAKEMLNLLQRVKDLAFGFMQEMMTVGEDSDKVSLDEAPSGNGQRNAKQLIDEFARSQLQEIFRCFMEWMDRNFAMPLRTVDLIVEELKVWNKVLQSDKLPSSLKQQWENLVLVGKLRVRIAQAEEVPLVETYCWISDNSLHPVINRCFEDLSEKTVDRLLKKRDEQEKAVGALMKTFMTVKSSGGLTATLLKLLLRKSCPMVNTSTETGWMEWFTHLLSWPLWTSFFCLTGDASHRRMLLGEEGQLVSYAESVVSGTEIRLRDRSITVAQLDLLKENKDRFLTLCRIWDSHQKGTKVLDKVHSSFLDRLTEVDNFKEEKRLVNKFVSACVTICTRDNGGLSDEVRLLSQRLKQDISSKEVRDLCCRDSEQSAAEVYFSVPPSWGEYLHPVANALSSDTFRRVWNETSREVGQIRRYEHKQTPNSLNPLTEFEISSSICAPTINQWRRLCVEVQDGNISLKRVSCLFGCLINDPGSLERELNFIDVCSPQHGSGEWKGQRQQQIEQYSKLKNKLEAARTLKSIITVLELSHSFKEFDIICEQDLPEFEQKPISAISDELLSVGKFLDTFTRDRIRCLESFAKTPNLVRWLTQEIKEWKELETFVELAETKCLEEGDLETVKMTHLHAACAGFAPLLFDVDKIRTFKDLQLCCETVFGSFTRDKELITKWVSTGMYLEEFKTTRGSLRSVEEYSFSQLEMINSHGKYQVGCLKSHGSSSRPVCTTDDCVELVIEVQREACPVSGKVYRLSDLLDLQSKLMLISRQSDKSKTDQVHVFVQVLDRAISLANVFIEICQAGHDKYFNWKFEFYCMNSRNRRFRRTPDADTRANELQQLLSWLSGHIQELTAALETWRQLVQRVRDSHYYLNYFTMSQLLILRQELGKLVCDREYQLPGEVFSLLGAVNPTCSRQSVTVAVSLDCRSPSRVQDSASPVSLPENHSDVQHLLDMGFSVDSAVAALKASNGDLSKATTLCLEKGPDLNTDQYEEEGDVALAMSLSLLEDPCTPARSCVITDSMSLDTLGKILKSLASTSPLLPRRAFPADLFRLGEPNLLVIPRNEFYLGILSLYLGDVSASLPSAQEVLLCSSKTTLEQICLFWRRVLGDPANRLFSLAMADLLSYEVSRKSWEEFNRLTQNRDRASPCPPYKVVIICNAENEDKSYMVDALYQYRRGSIPLPSVLEVKSYLMQQFQIPDSAASLDHENSSVRVIRSNRAGDGKSFFIDGIAERLTTLPQNHSLISAPLSQVDRRQQLHVVVPLHDHKIDEDTIMETLRPLSPCPDVPLARIVHVDVLSSTAKDLDTFLFSLLVLGEISDSEGYIWRKRPDDLYVIELTAPFQQTFVFRGSAHQAIANETTVKKRLHILFTDLLPTIHCRSPAEVQDFLAKGSTPAIGDPAMNDAEFRNPNFQRAFQYLDRFNKGVDLDLFVFSAESIEGNHSSFLQTLRSNCGIPNPSWAELKYFVNFLSSQFCDYENNDFCNPKAYGEDLPGFKAFVLKLMIHMSRDFATRSLDYEAGADHAENELVQLRRRWEHSSHPYLVFNEDRHSVTFIEVQITRDGQLMDPRSGSGHTLETIMSRQLSNALYTQGFRLQDNYDNWTKHKKLTELCRVMGVVNVHDPDESYELTMDNVKKILAIQMRFRCGIPVILMGETGCGKTLLIRYMCALQSSLTGAKNMLLMKVHGGITRRDIINKVKEAEDLAAWNRSMFGDYKIQTVLFFDEANTTDALGLIKEVMCDRRINGRKVESLGSSLHVIAACNPYRKHTAEMIERLEAAGLGYHVKSNETEDKLGHIPLRQLVYRVHALPESMKALVWDFGRLDQNIERLYIRQIVSRHVEFKQSLPSLPGIVNVLTNVLAAAQGFMRMQEDECSFVSLRDVERAMMVMVWFYNLHGLLEQALDAKHEKTQDLLPAERRLPPLKWLTRALVLALGVCYQARLYDRRSFLHAVVEHFTPPCDVVGGIEELLREIKHCQEVFLDEIDLPPQIAKNHALSENVFMMVACIDLRIPLFLVGKPGSSKSFAKDVVKNAMKGQLSSSKLFQNLKQLYMVSYQCSPLSTAAGIIRTFQQCQRAQKEPDKTSFVSCVVLDEVGLAEDSPRLPLKALHPLLDDGTAEDEDDERSSRVAFVGLSNWALDPAKMNRGVLVNRQEPDNDELVVSAQEICSSGDDTVKNSMDPLIDGLASAYKDICLRQEREFFGLRDFYSLVKMLFAFCRSTRQCPTWIQLEHSVRRNFGGQEQVDVVEVYRRCCHAATNDSSAGIDNAVDNTAVGLIQANLQKNAVDSLGESRYLLLLTKNFAALNIIRQRILTNDDPVIIFGSSFPKDQEYTQICRTINRIKVCMATGDTVVLLNLDQLYESLYDALNQYYVYHGDQRFVDLGLGNHRVKCQVHKDFRLILVAESAVVYKDYPIPLINRMEKHFLAMESVLSPEQQIVVEKVNAWARQFAEINPEDHIFRRGERQPAKCGVADAFIGFNQDAAATVVLQACRAKAGLTGEVSTQFNDSRKLDEVFDIAIRSLLNCASPDAVARLHVSSLSADAGKLWDIYFCEQQHSSLLEYLKAKIAKVECRQHCLLQATTHSRLLSADGLSEIGNAIGIEMESLALQQFDTEQQFEKRLEEFYQPRSVNESVLLVQCEAGVTNSELIACSRYLIQEKRDFALRNYGTSDFTPIYRRHLVFVIQLPRVSSSSFVGFQGGGWDEVHIDELRLANGVLTPSITALAGRKISSLLGSRAESESRDIVFKSASGEGKTGDNGAGKDTESLVKELPVLDAESVLRTCVHDAVSRLDDQADTMDNASKRLHILLQLIPDCELFYKQLKWQVIRLLQESESRMVADASTHWVRNEALSHSSLHVGGTFRRALWLRVVDTVTPILAEVIAFIDHNFNLQLISEAAAGASNWITDLWLELFSSSLVSHRRYDFMPPIQNELRQRVHVQSSGFRGDLFHCRFPFSHVIKSEVDGMVLEARRMATERQEKLHVALKRLFDCSELGAIAFKTLQNRQEVEKDMSLRYLHDFVRMVYYATSEEEYKLVESTILCGLRELPGTREESANAVRPLELTIPTIHAAFEQVRSRVYCLRDLVHLYPEIVGKLHQQILEINRPELLADVIAASFLLEILTPGTFLSDRKQRDQWLKNVQTAKPVIESSLSLAFPGELRNDLCQRNRKAWAVCSAVRLFTEHTRAVVQDPFVLEAAVTLYECIKDFDVDFTKANTIVIIQRFLNECSKNYATKLFGPNNEECIICQIEWRSKKPVVLPCKHIFCRSCILKCLERNQTCPTCSQSVPPNFKLSASDDLIVASEAYRFFKRCSTAFFMELISVHSFSEEASQPPEEELVRKLMELVVQGPLSESESTRPFSPFNEDAIDPRPVVRSFILQLLLKYNPSVTLKYVKMVFANARGFIQGDNMENLTDLCFLFVDCIEDSLHQRSCRSPVEKRASDAVDELRNSTEKLKAEKYTVDHLQGVAGARFALTVTAQALGDLTDDEGTSSVSQRGDTSLRFAPSSVIPSSIAQLLSAANAMNKDIREPQFGIFLVKQLVRSRGLDIIDKLQEKYGSQMQWLTEMLEQDTAEPAMPDYFLVLGQPYKLFRTAVERTVFSGKTRYIEDLLKKQTHQDASAFLLLAIYREITSVRALGIERQIPTQTLNLIEEYCKESALLPPWAKSLATDLINNSQGRPLDQMQVLPGLSAQNRSLAGLALHIFTTISVSDGVGLVQPLRLMLTQPGLLVNSFWPTMPEDYYIEAKNVADGTRWYECKNGHPYLVLNCGKPVQTLRCPDCGEKIGRNTGDHDAREHASTQTGHVLGPANRRLQDAVPERDLSPSACSLVRLLMHCVLVWASCSQDQNVSNRVVDVVKTPVPQEGLAAFFWSHFELDTRLFAKAIGRSVEDAVVVCHRLLERIASSRDAHQERIGNGHLVSVQERKDWEVAFNKTYITPVFQEMQIKMTDWLQQVMNDNKLENNQVIRRIYELDHPESSSSYPRLWRYRVRVSIDHLTHTFEQNMSACGPTQCRLLREFLKQEPKLRALQYLPDVVKLQRLLMDEYDRRISVQEARTFSVGEFLCSIEDREKKMVFQRLIESFNMAWDLVREHVLSHGHLKPKNKEHELLYIVKETPLAYLLPRTVDEGTCATALVDYLVNSIHNEFLRTYRRLSGQEWEPERVPVDFVTRAHLVAYDVKRDLMPLVLAHCDYSLSVGQGTNITYNLASLERQIVNRFLHGKAHVEMKDYRIAFRKDVYNSSLFLRLKQRIPQEDLPLPFQRQIISDFCHLTEVHSVLAVVDIVIGFIVSAGGSSDTLIHEYIHETLKMPPESGLVSIRAKQQCRLKHVVSLWRLLTLEKGRHLSLANQEPFEYVSSAYKEKMDTDTCQELVKAFRKLNIDAFLLELVEIITLELQRWDETPHMEQYELRLAMEELYGSVLRGLDHIPSQVQLKHLLHCWKIAVKFESELASAR